MLKRWLALAGLVIVLDQCSKLYIAGHFFYGESLPVLSVFSLVLWHNEGAAYGFLNDFGGLQRWLFSGIAVGASGWMIWLLRKHANQTLFPLALSLILGGALGNLNRPDRLRIRRRFFIVSLGCAYLSGFQRGGFGDYVRRSVVDLGKFHGEKTCNYC